jgi:uncharacterized protein YigE (DUF2233 family)
MHLRPHFIAMFVLLAGCEKRVTPAVDAETRPTVSVTSDATGLPRFVQHNGSEWTTFDLDLRSVEFSLVGQRPDEPRTFDALGPFLAARKRHLVLATNAGIFNPQHRPLGLHIQDGQTIVPLSTADGEGNFFLKPNGVFWIDERGAFVAPADRYTPRGMVTLATQSGPLLLAERRIHPAFVESSTSVRLRSGVGVDTRGHVIVVLSKARVTFHATATLFRDVFNCPDALYLDGEISAMVAPGMTPAERHEYAALLVVTKHAENIQ